ncbi:MAG TPA: hypothetical protein DCE78_12190 [Bacteroidetes bacterium]|nr:hypothetical protein [Bacteroidota bacterium]
MTIDQLEFGQLSPLKMTSTSKKQRKSEQYGGFLLACWVSKLGQVSSIDTGLFRLFIIFWDAVN